MNAVRVEAYAKVNLLLRVLAREADGYHGLETLFALIDLHDTVVAERRDGHDVTLDVEAVRAKKLLERVAARILALARGDAVRDREDGGGHDLTFSMRRTSSTAISLSIAFAMS
jgi:4-diphosphocytidyl-2C-methyl-D-erythritol kinase